MIRCRRVPRPLLCLPDTAFGLAQHTVGHRLDAAALLYELAHIARQLAVLTVGAAIEPFGRGLIASLGVLSARPCLRYESRLLRLAERDLHGLPRLT